MKKALLSLVALLMALCLHAYKYDYTTVAGDPLDAKIYKIGRAHV